MVISIVILAVVSVMLVFCLAFAHSDIKKYHAKCKDKQAQIDYLRDLPNSHLKAKEDLLQAQKKRLERMSEILCEREGRLKRIENLVREEPPLPAIRTLRTIAQEMETVIAEKINKVMTASGEELAS